MTNDYENLKNDLKALYPDQELTEAELNKAADNLIQFFTIGTRAVFEAKKTLGVRMKNKKRFKRLKTAVLVKIIAYFPNQSRHN
jgi:hypothetical protein